MAIERDILDGLTKCLHAHAGFDLPTWVVESRSLARSRALSLTPEAYLDLLRSPEGETELRALVEAVRVGETRFFRHRPHVHSLLEVVIPSWRARGLTTPRVWSAGCATGEEAYTLALVLARALPRPAFKPSILATDVSEEALVTARGATYPGDAIGSVPDQWRGGVLFDREAMRVRPEVAALVTFERQNLADTVSPRGFDLVWCRNVLIYFGPAARRRALEKLVFALNPGGFLFVGYSETLRDVPGLTAVKHGDQVLWQKPVSIDGPGAGVSSRRPFVGGGAAGLSRGGVGGGVPGSGVGGGASRSGVGGGQSRGETPSLPPRASVLPPRSGVVPPRASVVPPRASVVPPRASVRPGPLRPAGGVGSSRDTGPREAPLPAASGRRLGARVTMAIQSTEPSALAEQIKQILSARGLRELTVDLDTAAYLSDEVAQVLRRAANAASSLGIDLVLSATRPGPNRWLRRNGLGDLTDGDGDDR
ncbi:MAG: CheR family methyltransferase [Polyangiaceae bacterium]